MPDPADTRPAAYPDHVRIVEVGPRDGFQAEREWIPTEVKIEIVNALIDAGPRPIRGSLHDA